ncbi:hypothetical protein SAMN04487881_0059 [Marinobacter sp. es.048]|nr:hypothetical protein SAMN04487881_0059 [Marinobacter sp. es.048]
MTFGQKEFSGKNRHFLRITTALFWDFIAAHTNTRLNDTLMRILCVGWYKIREGDEARA